MQIFLRQLCAVHPDNIGVSQATHDSDLELFSFRFSLSTPAWRCSKFRSAVWLVADLTWGLNIAVKHFFQVSFSISAFSGLETCYVILSAMNKKTLPVFARSQEAQIQV